MSQDKPKTNFDKPKVIAANLDGKPKVQFHDDGAGFDRPKTDPRVNDLSGDLGGSANSTA